MVQNSPPTSALDEWYQDDNIETSISVEDNENDIKRDATTAAHKIPGGILFHIVTLSDRGWSLLADSGISSPHQIVPHTQCGKVQVRSILGENDLYKAMRP